MTEPPERRGIVRSVRHGRWYRRLEIPVAGFALWVALWLLRWTIRFQVVGLQALLEAWRAGRPFVLVFWHGRSLMLPFLQRHAADCGAKVWIMNSPHRDGQIVSHALERFGIRCVRGSSSRGAVAGTLHLARALRGGSNVALAPDGPRGPAGVAKPGAVELAMIAGAPLCPLAFSASRSVRLRSWDRLMLPLPGARVACVVGEPLVVATGDGSRPDRERLRAELERRLVAACNAADRVVGRTPEDR